MDVQCPENILSLKKEAYTDFKQEMSQQIGLMHCFCLKLASQEGADAVNISFDDVDPEI